MSPICPSTIILLATGPLKPALARVLAGLWPVLLFYGETGINLLHVFAYSR